MGLMKTLVNVAVGVAIAKGMQSLSGRGRSGGSTRTAGGGGGLGDMLGDMLSGGGSGSGGGIGQMQPTHQPERQPTRQPGRGTPFGRGADRGGLEGMMDSILNGGRGTGSADTGSIATGRIGTGGVGTGTQIGGSRSSTAKNPRKNAPAGGLEDLLTTATSGRSGGGGLGDLLGGLVGGLAGGAIGAGTAPRTLPEPSERQETLEAAVLLRCMVQAAKCDGDLDADEKAKLMDAMGDATKAEIDFVNAELSAQMDVDGLARQIPNGMEEKAYLVSLMAINLDQQGEADYLKTLATALELSPQDANRLHDQLNAPRIYN